MKQSTILTGGLVLFGAGLLAGHYGTVIITTDLSNPKVNSQAISSSVVPQSQPAPSRVVSSPITSQSQPAPSKVVSSPVAPQSQSARPNLVASSAKSRSAGPDSSAIPPPPPEFVLTAEEQSQLMAQQKEAIQAQIEQLEKIIQSMKENGLPEEDIKTFTEFKRAMEEQQIAEPEPSQANRPESTVDEIKNDFATSFEQAGMPPVERDRMIKDLFSSLESTNESAGDLNVEPPLPLPAEERIK